MTTFVEHSECPIQGTNPVLANTPPVNALRKSVGVGPIVLERIKYQKVGSRDGKEQFASPAEIATS
jgi:hypothetical protein